LLAIAIELNWEGIGFSKSQVGVGLYQVEGLHASCSSAVIALVSGVSSGQCNNSSIKTCCLVGSGIFLMSGILISSSSFISDWTSLIKLLHLPLSFPILSLGFVIKDPWLDFERQLSLEISLFLAALEEVPVMCLAVWGILVAFYFDVLEVWISFV